MMRKIPLLKVHMPDSVQESLLKTLSSGFVTEGPRVAEFEKAAGEYIGNANAAATNNCTSAIHIALQISGVGAGDEVVTTAMTCQATNQPILKSGGKVVWADIQPDTGNIDPNDIKRKISNKTKAIIMMHWAGQPCDIDEINLIAVEKGIKVIEDAASAFGAEYKGNKIGTISDFTCFSFGAVKHITTGDGGMMTFKEKDNVERAILLRNHGTDKKAHRTETEWDFNIYESAWKFSMNDIAATIGIEQMKYQELLLEKRRSNADYYDKNLKDVSGLKILSRKNDRNSACWIYTVLVENKEGFVKALREKGIQTSIVHQRNDIHPIYSSSRTDLPNLDYFYKRMINIPVGWWLSKEDIEYIVESIKSGW